MPVNFCSTVVESERVVVLTTTSYVNPEEEVAVSSRVVTLTEDLEVTAASSPRVAGIASCSNSNSWVGASPPSRPNERVVHGVEVEADVRVAASSRMT